MTKSRADLCPNTSQTESSLHCMPLQYATLSSIMAPIRVLYLSVFLTTNVKLWEIGLYSIKRVFLAPAERLELSEQLSVHVHRISLWLEISLYLYHLSPDAAVAAAAKWLQLCPTLCDPIDGSPPGSPVPGILQARTLEWVAIAFSNAWKWKGKVKSLSCVWLLVTPWTATYQAPLSLGFSRQEWVAIAFSMCPDDEVIYNKSIIKRYNKCSPWM